MRILIRSQGIIDPTACAWGAWKAASLLDSATDATYANEEPTRELLGEINVALRQMQRDCELPREKVEPILNLVQQGKAADARKATRDLLSNTASVYSDKPASRFVVFNEATSGPSRAFEKILGLLPTNDDRQKVCSTLNKVTDMTWGELSTAVSRRDSKALDHLTEDLKFSEKAVTLCAILKAKAPQMPFAGIG